MKYVLLATRQKHTNATPVRKRGRPCVSTPAAPGAATTSTFLSHCFGRASRRSAGVRRSRSAKSSLGRSSFTRRPVYGRVVWTRLDLERLVFDVGHEPLHRPHRDAGT